MSDPTVQDRSDHRIGRVSIRALIALISTLATCIAASVGFVWQYPAEELPRLAEFRLYETSGRLVGSSTNLTFRGDFTAGEHSVYVLAVSKEGIASDPSNTVTFWVPRPVTNIAIIVVGQ